MSASVGPEAVREGRMPKESTTTKQVCPHGCPLCALYEAQEAVQEGITRCVPVEVRAHLNRAARELLFALRVLFEKGMEAIAEEPKAGSRRNAQKVKVE